MKKSNKSNTKETILSSKSGSDNDFLLNHFLRKVTKQNSHESIDFGKTVGREVW